jgi:hypothetical protein
MDEIKVKKRLDLELSGLNPVVFQGRDFVRLDQNSTLHRHAGQC